MRPWNGRLPYPTLLDFTSHKRREPPAPHGREGLVVTRPRERPRRRASEVGRALDLSGPLLLVLVLAVDAEVVVQREAQLVQVVERIVARGC